MDETDEAFLQRAVELARRSPRADPNPAVGAVIVDASVVVGEGFHRGAGTAHAEVEALAQAGTRARGATAYVSLEPCNHTGRTGPCAEALLAAGIARVVYAQADTNQLAAGGAQTLRRAGVRVELAPAGSPAAAEAASINRSWHFARRNHRPLVTWKYASTLDGRCAAADGSAQWITGEQARADVHRQRAECGAIMVGTGTVLADDPSLTARPGGHLAERQPCRAIVGSRPLPPQAKVFDAAAPTLRFPDPSRALDELAARGVHHVWLEGGPGLAASMMRRGLVDEIVAYFAPLLLGAGPSVVADLGIGTLAEARRFRLTDVTRLGGDVRLKMTREDPAVPHRTPALQHSPNISAKE